MNFVHDQDIHSLARIQERELLREDYCANCWPEASRETCYSRWSTRYYDAAVAEQEPPEQFSPLRQTFYEALEEDGRQSLSVAYLAAQLLRRQKVFRRIKESDGEAGETKLTLFSDRIGGRLIEVKDPDLTHAELEEGRTILMERLYALEAPDEEEDETEGDTDTLEHAANAQKDE